MADCNILELRWDERANIVIQSPKKQRLSSSAHSFSKTPTKLYKTASERTGKMPSEKSYKTNGSNIVDLTSSEITVTRLVPKQEPFTRGQRRSCPSLESKETGIRVMTTIFERLGSHSELIQDIQEGNNFANNTDKNTGDLLDVNSLKVGSDSNKAQQALRQNKDSYDRKDEADECLKQSVTVQNGDQMISSWSRPDQNEQMQSENDLQKALKILKTTLRHKMTELDITRKKLEMSTITGSRRLNSINDLRGLVRLLQTRHSESVESKKILEEYTNSLIETAAKSKERLSKYLKENYLLQRENEKLAMSELSNKELIESLQEKVKVLEASVKRKEAELKQSAAQGKIFADSESRKFNDHLKTSSNKQQVLDRKIENMTRAIEILVQLSYERRLHAFIEAQQRPSVEQNMSGTIASHLMASYRKTADDRVKKCLDEVHELMDTVNFGERLGKCLFNFTSNSFI